MNKVTLNIEIAGTLDKLLSSMNRYKIESLELIGKIDYSDIQIIRRLSCSKYSFTFRGYTIYKNAGQMREAMLAQGIGRLMLETDCPYLAPVPLRGSVNEPSNIPVILRAAAEIFGVDEKYIADAAYENSVEFFGLSD